jgi:hypothetical protein
MYTTLGETRGTRLRDLPRTHQTLCLLEASFSNLQPVLAYGCRPCEALTSAW